MSKKYKFNNPDGLYFITTTTVNWVDIFTRTAYKDVLIDSLKHCQQHKGLHIHAYVIMTNHIHLIVSTEDSRMLSNIFRDFKKYTSVELVKMIVDNPQESRSKWLLSMLGFEGRKHPDNKHYKVWQDGVHPKELNTDDKMMAALNYIHNNPVKAGIVYEPWEYVYSSAMDYMADGKGLLPLDLLM